MANCFIIEFDALPRDIKGEPMQAGRLPGKARQSVSFTTSAQSNAFVGNYIRVIADAKAHFQVGDSPVATAGDAYLSQDTPEYFAVRPGEKIAVYDGSS